MEPILLSRRDACKMLSISLRKLDYLISSDQITVRRIGKRVLIPPGSLKAFARGDDPRRHSPMVGRRRVKGRRGRDA